MYDWTSSDEIDYLAGGELDLYDGKIAQPPVAPLGLTASSTVNADGTVTPTINVSWTAASDSFTDYYLVQWYNSTTGGTAVNSSTKTTAFTIGPVEPASEYAVTVYAYNGLGVRSTALTGNVTTISDTTPKLPSIYQINTDSAVEPTATQFADAAGRGPKEGDIVIGTDTTVTPNKTYAWSYNLSSTEWTANSNFISGDLIVDGSITATELAADSVEADKISVDNLAAINADLGSITAGSIDGVTVKIGSGSSVFKADTNGIYLGNETFSNADFRVTPAGAITATGATINGTLTLSNIDGTTVTYSEGNLQVGAIATENISENAVTNALIATDAVNQDSIAANSVTANEIVANTITAIEIAANTITAIEIAANTITGDQITADSIQVDKLTGDISETYPINYPSSIQTCTGGGTVDNDVRLTIPAPTGGVEKNASVSLTVKLSAANSSSSGTATVIASCDVRLQRLSTGITTGTSVGGMVTQVLTLPNNIKRLKIVGNHISKLGTIGSICRSSTGAAGNAITPVLGYSYQNTVTGYSGNHTYIYTTSASDITVGSSVYFNKDAWVSQGTYISSEAYETLYFQIQPGDTVSKEYTINEAFGGTLSGENFRLTVKQNQPWNYSNVPITVHSVSGVMQLIT